MQTSVNPQSATKDQFYFPLLIVLMATLSCTRLLFLNNIFWDDHCWMEAVFTSNNLSEFLNTGFIELRRVPLGIFIYLTLIPFKISNHTYLAYFIPHLITIITQIVSPVFLYLIIYKLFKNRLIAFIIGSILIIYPIDMTIPVLVNLSYSLGFMFSVISLYITVRAISDKIKWSYLIVALILSGVSNYFLVEGTVALEPARLFVMAFVLYSKGYQRNEVLKYSIIYWLPFILLCVPLILYKLLYKPYGLYAPYYQSDWLFFLRVRSLHLPYLAMLLGKNWFFFLGKITHVSLWSVGGALMAFIATYIILGKNYAGESGFQELSQLSVNPNSNSRPTNLKMIFCFGFLLLVPVVCMFEYAGRGLGTGFASRHGCIMRFGHAVIIGALLCVGFNKLFVASKYRKQFIALSMAILFGLGVFFDNLNLDLYFNVWNQEKQFYNAFMKRFPAVPEKADFMFDVQMGTYDEVYHLYNFEFPFNMLYAQSNKPKDFRGHKITSWYFLNTYKKVGPTQYETLFHWGKDIFDIKNLIVIRWRPGEFLVNREIVEKYPQIEYKALADKDIPPIPGATTYPLRGKMNLF